MYNFIFTADGKFIKRDIYETFNNNFSVSNDQICIDDTCLTKSEITLIKNQVSMNEIDKIINDKDSLTNKDAIIYVKDILLQLKNSNDNQYKSELFKKYLSYGIYDERTSSISKFNDHYLQLDFNKFYDNMDNRAIYSVNFKEDEVLDILKNNRVDDKNDERKKYVILDNNIIGVNSNYYYFINDGYIFIIIKLRTENENRWRVLITNDNLVDKISINMDENYYLMYKDYFNNIAIINSNVNLLRDDFLNLVNNFKTISILDGNYNYKVFRNNFFLKKYDNLINLDIYDENYFIENILNSNVFIKNTFSSDKIIDLKLRMDIDDINLDYYKLNNSLFIYLVRILDKGGIEYKWNILILDNSI